MMVSVVLALLPGAAPEKSEVLFVTIYEIGNGSIIVVKSPTGTGRSGGRRGRGRRGGQRMTLPVASDVQATTANYRRKTRQFRIGAPLGGGLKNKVIRSLEPRALARIVVVKGQVVEMNVVVDSSDATTVIAIRPKRPPTKE